MLDRLHAVFTEHKTEMLIAAAIGFAIHALLF